MFQNYRVNYKKGNKRMNTMPTPNNVENNNRNSRSVFMVYIKASVNCIDIVWTCFIIFQYVHASPNATNCIKHQRLDWKLYVLA